MSPAISPKKHLSIAYRSLSAVVGLAFMPTSGFALAADIPDEALIPVCQSGSNATVSRNVVGDYLGGALLGMCAKATGF